MFGDGYKTVQFNSQIIGIDELGLKGGKREPTAKYDMGTLKWSFSKSRFRFYVRVFSAHVELPRAYKETQCRINKNREMKDMSK